MKKITLGLSALALALSGAAIAVAAPHMMHEGKTLTRAEAQAHAEAAFAKLDLNHDGKLDKADRSARLSEHFDKIDTNHDGTISRDEFTAAHEAMMGGMHGMRGDIPPPGDGPRGDGPNGDRHEHGGREGRWGHGPRHPGEGMPMLMEIMAIADPAHTGTITKDAFVGAALKLFDQADTNHDGTVTAQERKAAGEKMRAEMRAKFEKHAPAPAKTTGG